MINYFRRKFGKLLLSVIVIICIYNSVNLTFFNEKSVTKIFEMNENIILLNQELLNLQQIEEKLMTKIEFLSFANFLQNESKLIPTVAHKRESLTAALLQIITKGDKAKLSAPVKAKVVLLRDFCGQQYKVSAIISIKNNDDSADGSLAESEPKLSQVELPGSE